MAFKARAGLPLELRREFKRIYFEGVGHLAARGVRSAVASGLDATGAELPPYQSGPLEGTTVLLRKSGLMLDSFRPTTVTEDEVIVSSSASYTRYVQRRYRHIGITGETLAEVKRYVQVAMEEVVRKASIRSQGGPRRSAGALKRRARG